MISQKEQLTSLTHTLERLSFVRSTQALRSAEMSITAVQQYPNYFDLLLKLLPNQQLPFQVRKLATVFINLYINDRLPEKISQLKQHAHKILEQIGRQNIDFRLKVDLSLAIASIVKLDRKHAIFTSFMQTLKISLSILEQEQSILNYSICILMGRTLVQSAPISKQSIKKQLSYFFNKYLELTIYFQGLLFATLSHNQALKISQTLSQLFQLLIQFNKKTSHYLAFDRNQQLLVMTIITNGQLKTLQFCTRLKHTKNQALVCNLNTLKVNRYDFILSLMSKRQNLALPDFHSRVYTVIQQIINGLNGLYVVKSQYPGVIYKQEVVRSQLKFLIQAYTLKSNTINFQGFARSLLKIISRILEYDSYQFNYFYSQPVLFVNSLIEIIQCDRLQKDNQEQLQQFYSLKVQAAILLRLVVQTHPYLLQSIIQQLIMSVSYNSGESMTALLMLNILKKDINSNINYLNIIGSLTEALISKLPPLENQSSEEDQLKYAYGIVTLSTFSQSFSAYSQVFLRNIILLALQLITGEVYYQVYQLLGSELLQSIIQKNPNSQQFILNILSQINMQLFEKSRKGSVNVNFLDSLFYILEHIQIQNKNLQQFVSANFQLIEQILRNLSYCIEQQIKKHHPNKLIINKSWNVLRKIGQNSYFLEKISTTLEQTITPLFDHLLTNLDSDFQEDFFLLMTAIIKKFQRLSHFCIQMYRLIPIVFYKKYGLRFGHSFQVLQAMIFYGKQEIAGNYQIYEEIVVMCFHSMFLEYESDCCQGVLLLHSIVLNLWQVIGQQYWLRILTNVTKRLRTVHFKPLRERQIYIIQSLTCLSALCLIKMPSKFIQPSSINETITRLNDQTKYCQDIYLQKLMLYCTCQLLSKLQKKSLRYKLDDITQLLYQAKKLLQDVVVLPKNKQKYGQFKILRDYVCNMIVELNLKNYLQLFLNKFSEICEKEVLVDILHQTNMFVMFQKMPEEQYCKDRFEKVYQVEIMSQ